MNHALLQRAVRQALTLALFVCAPLQAAEPSCASPASVVTQAAMNFCAQEAFEAATAVYAQRYAELAALLPSQQRAHLRRMQSTWLAYRTAACRYESGPTNGGSAQGLVYWRCATRMTEQRSVEMAALAQCREGDITCAVRRP